MDSGAARKSFILDHLQGFMIVSVINDCEAERCTTFICTKHNRYQGQISSYDKSPNEARGRNYLNSPFEMKSVLAPQGFWGLANV